MLISWEQRSELMFVTALCKPSTSPIEEHLEGWRITIPKWQQLTRLRHQ